MKSNKIFKEFIQDYYINIWFVKNWLTCVLTQNYNNPNQNEKEPTQIIFQNQFMLMSISFPV